MIHALAHLLGLDTQQSAAYDFWSGVATQASLLAAGAGAYRKHRCHGCWRMGRHTVNGSPWCDRHHEAARKEQGNGE